jgi:serine/threonine protein kinase
MAPEQANGAAPTPGTDVYALASVLFELITGELPFQGQSIPVLLEAKRTAALVPASKRDLGNAVPRALDRILCKALATDPSGRFETAEAFRLALEAALSASTAATKARSRHVMRLASGVALLGLISAGALYASPELRSASITARDWALTRPVVSSNLPVLHKSAAAVRSYSDRMLASLRQLHSHSGTSVANTTPAVEPHSVEQPELAGAPDKDNKTTIAKGPAPVVETKTGPEAELERVSYWLENGQPSRALRAARRLGNQYPENASIMAVWQQAALQTKAWGEARSVAEQRARFDKSEDALMSLARLQRATGQNDSAKLTLQRLVKAYPNSEEARAQLERLEPKPRVAAR